MSDQPRDLQTHQNTITGADWSRSLPAARVRRAQTAKRIKEQIQAAKPKTS